MNRTQNLRIAFGGLSLLIILLAGAVARAFCRRPTASARGTADSAGSERSTRNGRESQHRINGGACWTSRGSTRARDDSWRQFFHC